MESEQEELGEDQALLILYLSGELSEDRHAALERRLVTEEPLRQELESLRAAQAMIWREMLAADSSQPFKGAASTAHRKLAGMVRQWAAERLAKEPATPRRSIPWGKWWPAVAAVLAVAAGLAVYFYEPGSPAADDQVADSVERVITPLEGNFTMPEPAEDAFVSAGLNDVEAELNELAQLRMFDTAN